MFINLVLIFPNTNLLYYILNLGYYFYFEIGNFPSGSISKRRGTEEKKKILKELKKDKRAGGKAQEKERRHGSWGKPTRSPIY